MRRRSYKKQTIALIAALTLVVAVAVATGLSGGSSATPAATSQESLDTSFSDVADAYAEGVVEIDLSDPAGSDASDVSIKDGVVKIGAAGVYSLSGTLSDGQIEIDTKGKVYLELNGIEVTSTSGPALWIKNAKKVTLVLTAGTINSLASAATDDAAAATDDGATTAGGAATATSSAATAVLLSNDSLAFTGSGSLNVSGSDASGISSDDDIVINSGTITVTALGDGIAANDGITINGGDVSVTSGGDGLDSNGEVCVNGGRLLTFGGTAQGEGGIDTRGGLTITGGTVVAGGNALAALSTDSRQTCVYVTSGAIQPGGTNVSLRREGQDVFAFTPSVAYQNVLISSADLTSGVAYQAYLGDKPGNLVMAAR